MPRGSDFTARWSEGAWAELRIIEAINNEPDLIAVQYGITDGEAFWSIRDMEARELPDQTKHGKRPDVLVFDSREITADELATVKKVCELDDDSCKAIVRKAKLAIESEFSPYNYAHRLTQYGKGLSFTIKEEDLQPTVDWRAHFGVGTEAMDTTTAGWELLFHVMGALAQFERRLNAERSRAGIAAARRRGKHLGRPADLTPEKIRHARQMIDSGEQSVTGMAKLLDVHRVTLHKALKRTAGRARA